LKSLQLNVKGIIERKLIAKNTKMKSVISKVYYLKQQ